MREEPRSSNARVGVRVNSCDTNFWRGIHHVCLCRMPYRGGRPQIQGESHLLTNGRVRCDSGMDWLASNHVVINCGQRRVVFPDAEGLELISSNQAEKEIEAGATCFMIVAQMEKKSTA